MRTLVHAYFTNGFVEMAKVFLESLQVTTVSAPLVWLDTRNLKAPQIQKLYEIYGTEKLHIVNRTIPMKDWAKRAGVTVEELRSYKRQCEQRFVSNKNRVWKLLTAGDDRVQALYNLLWGVPEMPASDLPNWQSERVVIAHFDIDTLFRKPLVGLPGMMQKANIWLKLRPNHNIVKARITIDCIFVRGTRDVRKFFDRWRYHINRVLPPNRPVGWGQASCWHAFVEEEKRLKYETLPLEYGLPGRNHKEDVIWTGNVHKLAKADFVKLCKREVKTMQGSSK